MATAAQILANTRNAARSTGPRTVKGKSIVRGNALKHGRDALTLMPGLELEDAKQVKQRVARYLDDWQPRTDAELDLVCQAARLSLAIERAERMEIAHMEGRIRAATKDRIQEVQPRRLEEVQELGRRLLYIAALDEIKVPRKPLWSDDPRLLVAKLEETADGCRWLLARWAEFRHLLDSRTHWELPVLLRFIRLQGKVVDESVFDPACNAIFLAWDVIIPEFAKHYWEKFRDNPCQAQTASLSQLRWREIAPRPSDTEEAWKSFDAIVDRQSERLEALLKRNKDMEREEPAGWTDRAALDLSPEFERHRRYLSAKTREFHRALETLRKMRESDGGKGKWQIANDKSRMTNGECQMADGNEETNGECQMADGHEGTNGECRMADGNEETNGECRMADGNEETNGECQMADGNEELADGEEQVTDGICQVLDDLAQVPADELRECAEVSVPEMTGEEASNSAQQIMLEAAQQEQRNGRPQRSEDALTMPENFQNKANWKSAQATRNQEVTSIIASRQQAEQTQSAGPADSGSTVWQHGLVPRAVQPGVPTPGVSPDLHPDRDCDPDSDRVRLGDLQDAGQTVGADLTG